MTSEDVRKVTFERIMRGYRPEDVDDFLQQAAIQMDALAAEKENCEAKMRVLAQKVEEYRGQEDMLKTAMINAQRMGETVVHEAKQKAESLIRDAEGKSQLLRQQAEQEINNERFMLEKLREEVTRFRTTILSLYKQHIESFSALDAPVVRVEEFLTEYQYANTPYVPQGNPVQEDIQQVLVEEPGIEEFDTSPEAQGILPDEPPIEEFPPEEELLPEEDAVPLNADYASISYFGTAAVEEVMNERPPEEEDEFEPTPRRPRNDDEPPKRRGKK